MPTLREILPWAGLILAILIIAIIALWLNYQPENTLPEVYGVL